MISLIRVPPGAGEDTKNGGDGMAEAPWIDRKEYPFKSHFLQQEQGSELCPVIEDFLKK
jgi:hypothetical protein